MSPDEGTGPRSDRAVDTAGDAHLRMIHMEEAAVASIESASSRLVGVARRAIGLDRATPAPPTSLGAGIRASQAGWFTVLALGAFMATDQILGFVLATFGPEVSGALGMSRGSYGNAVALRATAAVGMSLQFGYALHRGLPPGRRILVVQAVFATAIGAGVAACSSSFWPLLIAVAITGPAAGMVWVGHRPMVMDAYLPAIRVRAMCLHQAGIVAGTLLAPALAGALSAWAGLSWRGVLLVVGAVAVVVGVVGLRLRDPSPGVHDDEPARVAVRAELDGGGEPVVDEPGLGYVETMRRLWLVPTARRLLVALAVLGIVIAPLPYYMSLLLRDHWRIGLAGRSGLFAAALVVALPALAWFGPRGDRMFDRDPGRLVMAASTMMSLLAAGLLLSVVTPWLPITIVGFAIALSTTALLVPVLSVVMLSIVRPGQRAAAGTLAAVFMVGVGGQGGALLLGGMDRRFGPGWSIAILVVPAVIAARAVRGAATTVNADLDGMLTSVVEEEQISAMTSRGERLPMLAARRIDFSYGQLQVLFGVDFTVDDGEMVALLGTNGAGKSTLLKAISGIGLPSSGSVRFRGQDITYMDAERRVGLGITQIPGGRAVFGPMDVVENLRTFGYTLGSDRKVVDALIDECFDAFPRLHERRASLAGNLSGGEQQMLGLSKALILRPRLLLIDELSLGLGPIIVNHLLTMVRRINAAGTSVVLVEQSVSTALGLVDHAYFMEKGQMRFDGSASDLLGRGDLLRAVFLEGAGTAAPGATVGPRS